MQKWNMIFERSYFRLFFIFVVFLNTLSLRFWEIERNPLYPIVFIWALLIIGHDFWYASRRRAYFGPLLVYGVTLLLATLANTAYSTLDSYLIAVLQLIIFFLVFLNPPNRSLLSIRQEMRLVIPWVSLLTFVASSISLLMFFLNISLTRHGMTIGLVGERLFGIYFNCNPAAFLACISMVLSIWAFRQRFMFRYFYVLNSVVQLLYIILTGCRSVLLILAFYSICLLYVKVFRRYGFSHLKQVVLSVLTVVTIVFGANLVQKTLFIIPQLQGAKVEVENRFQFARLEEIMVMLREDPLGHFEEAAAIADEVSSGRIELLDDSLKIWKTAPLLGVGANNFRAVGLDVDPSSTVLQGAQVVHSHHVFLEALVTAGIVGFVSFLLFFVQSILTFWEALKKTSKTSFYAVVMLCLLIVVAEFIGSLFDYGIFYVYSLSATLAWQFLGYVYWLNDHLAEDLTCRDMEAID